MTMLFKVNIVLSVRDDAKLIYMVFSDFISFHNYQDCRLELIEQLDKISIFQYLTKFEFSISVVVY